MKEISQPDFIHCKNGEVLKDMATNLANRSLSCLEDFEMEAIAKLDLNLDMLRKEIIGSYYTALFTSYQQLVNTFYMEHAKSSLNSFDTDKVLEYVKSQAMGLVEDTYKYTLWSLDEGMANGAENARKVMYQMIQRKKKTQSQV